MGSCFVWGLRSLGLVCDLEFVIWNLSLLLGLQVKVDFLGFAVPENGDPD